MELNKVRKEIDRIDEEIIKLIAKRNQLAKDIAKIKFSFNLDINDINREKEKYKSIEELCKCYNVDKDICLKIFKILIEHNKDLQRKYIENLKK